MSTTILNEHDANQGAQSKGEFLGMTGNSGWYLLGSAGSTVMMVIVLWGVFEISLLLCLMVGLVLCVLSVVYVFTLKNNKPDQYDTDFFEDALADAGLAEITFGPRERRLTNAFRVPVVAAESAQLRHSARQKAEHASLSETRLRAATVTTPVAAAPIEPAREQKAAAKPKSDDAEPTVPLRNYEKLQVELEMTQEQLADALMEREED